MNTFDLLSSNLSNFFESSIIPQAQEDEVYRIKNESKIAQLDQEIESMRKNHQSSLDIINRENEILKKQLVRNELGSDS